MTENEAIEYAKTMTFRDAIYNLKQARCIPYKKATFIKINELLEIIEKDTEKELAESIIALIPHLPTKSDKARMQTATKERDRK